MRGFGMTISAGCSTTFRLFDVSALTEQARGDDTVGPATDTYALGCVLHEMLAEAERYLKAHSWCVEIVDRYLGFGVGGVIAVFLFKFGERIKGTDDFLWVVVGDLPSAYFVVDDAPSPNAALETYCDLMEEWVEAVLAGEPVDDVFPVSADATAKNAEMLKSRLGFLRSKIAPASGT